MVVMWTALHVTVLRVLTFVQIFEAGAGLNSAFLDLVSRGRFRLQCEENSYADQIHSGVCVALAAISAIPASVGSSFAQSNPNLDCTPYHGASTC